VDAPELAGLMRAFYAEAGLDLDEERAASAFRGQLADSRLGRVWLIERAGAVPAGGAAAVPRDKPALPRPADGYVVATFVYAMEYGGTVAVLDDFFVRPEARGEGLGKAALAAVRRACEDLGVRALRVEAGEDNAAALAVYRSAGFEPLAGRAVMALSLAPPLHER
jgi:GNAT superfamily N-acetyltransferase